MRAWLALATAALAASCLNAPPAAERIDAAPDDGDAAHVSTDVTYYLARGGFMTGQGGRDLAIIGKRGDGSHLGAIIPTGDAGLVASLQQAIWFELGDQRASDVLPGGPAEGLVVAGLAGRITVVPPTDASEPTVLELTPSVASPLVDGAFFDDDARLLVAGANRLWMQESLDDETVGIHLVGTTASGPVFMDVVTNPGSSIPYLGVVDGINLDFYEIMDGVPPQLSADLAGEALLPSKPPRAMWHLVEGSAQLIALDADTTAIHWFRVDYDGSSPMSASFPIEALDELIDFLPVQLDDAQEELIVMGRRGASLVVVAYTNALGVDGIALSEGTREWVAPDELGVAPMLAAADLDADVDPASEIVLVEKSGHVRCLDATDVALLESCGDADLSATSTSGRPGW